MNERLYWAAGGLLIAILVTGFTTKSQNPPQPLVLCCQSGLKGPVETVLDTFRGSHAIVCSYGNRQELQGEVLSSPIADLLITDDTELVDQIRVAGRLASVQVVARQKVVRVQRAAGAGQVARRPARFSAPDPAKTTLGRWLKTMSREGGGDGNWPDWDRLTPRQVTWRSDVLQVGRDVAAGRAETGVIGSGLLSYFPNLVAIQETGSERESLPVYIVELRTSAQPELAKQVTTALVDSGTFAAYGFLEAGEGGP